jgi:hypothetical protein
LGMVLFMRSVPWKLNGSFSEGEARHRKYKNIKLGGGQTYDRSCD